MPRLAVVGDLVEDVVVWATGPVRPGSDTPARVFRSRGGSAANVAIAAAPFVATRFVGRVGADVLGDGLVAQLVDAGVEVRVQQQGRTGTVVVLVDPDGERTFLSDRAAAAELGPVGPEVLAEVDLLHVPAYGLHAGPAADSIRDLLATAVEQGVDISLDASSWVVLREVDLRAVVEQVRPVVLLANAAEARELQLPIPGTTVVVKDGPRPTRVLGADGSTLTVPVEPVDGVRDSTGAGDAFAAGWLSARLAGLDDRRCAERAHALARQVLRSPGAGAATPEEQP